MYSATSKNMSGQGTELLFLYIAVRVKRTNAVEVELLLVLNINLRYSVSNPRRKRCPFVY